jgi:hypothetical protein
MVFTRHADGSVTVDHFAEEFTASYEWLANLDPRHAWVSDAYVVLELLGVWYDAVAFDDKACIATYRRQQRA